MPNLGSSHRSGGTPGAKGVGNEKGEAGLTKEREKGAGIGMLIRLVEGGMV